MRDGGMHGRGWGRMGGMHGGGHVWQGRGHVWCGAYMVKGMHGGAWVAGGRAWQILRDTVRLGAVRIQLEYILV